MWATEEQYLLVDVSIRQLRYFVAVAEELHFGRAAARLHMSQSPLSRAIRELEHELGLVLFVRTTRRVELTAAGSVLLERARRALAEIDAALADARRLRFEDRRRRELDGHQITISGVSVSDPVVRDCQRRLSLHAT